MRILRRIKLDALTHQGSLNHIICSCSRSGRYFGQVVGLDGVKGSSMTRFKPVLRLRLMAWRDPKEHQLQLADVPCGHGYSRVQVDHLIG